MTTYNTRALAEALDIEGTPKQATRELRKFLRATTPRDSQPGKGGRYSIDLNKRELNAMKKKFIAWQEEQAEARKARLEAKKAEAPITPEEPIVDEAPEEDKALEELEGPTDEEFDAMLAEVVDEA